jgi:hypothetical protein
MDGQLQDFDHFPEYESGLPAIDRPAPRGRLILS